MTNALSKFILLLLSFVLSSNVLMGLPPGDKGEIIVPDDNETEGPGQGNLWEEFIYNLDFADGVPNTSNNGATAFFLPGMPDAIITIYDIPAGTYNGSLPDEQYIIHQTAPFNEYDYNIDYACNGRSTPMYTLQFDFGTVIQNLYCGQSTGVIQLTDIVVAMTYEDVSQPLGSQITKYPYLQWPTMFTPCYYNYTSFAEVDHTTFYYPTVQFDCSGSSGGGNGNGNNGNNGNRSLQDKDLDIKVFPNPVKDVVRIASSSEITQLTLLDSSGKEILSNSAAISKGLDLNGLNNGMYFIKIETMDGVQIEKIIKSDN